MTLHQKVPPEVHASYSLNTNLPLDFDPEADGNDAGSTDSSDDASESEDAQDGREHYESVGKSKLRKPDEVELGPQYGGSTVSRTALENESDDDPFAKPHSDFEDESDDSEDDAQGDNLNGLDDSEEEEEVEEEDMRKLSLKGKAGKGAEKQKDEHTAGNRRAREQGSLSDAEADDDEDMENFDSEDGSDLAGLEDGESGSDDDTDATSEEKVELTGDRAVLRKMMAEEQASVAATISAAAKADAAKGVAVKTQRTTFDALLNTRIKLQKSLIATNTIPTMTSDSTTDGDSAGAIRAAEQAALKLWTSLDDLRTSLAGTKRKRPSSSSPSEELWAHMQGHEMLSVPKRRNILDKWSVRVRAATALPVARIKLNTATQQNITAVLDLHLAEPTNLIERTRSPRSCAPIQAAALQKSSKQAPDSAPDHHEIYDDADFYQTLLHELVNQRMADSTSAGATSTAIAALPTREAKMHRKGVDTKASKGRKIRYTVHEKLQNFMAAEDRGSWGLRQREELFSSLLGQRGRALAEEEDEDEVDGEADGEGEALRLFRT